MPRTEAAVRARSGQVSNSVVTLERPDTWVLGPEGEVFKLPKRAGGGMPTIQNKKVNGLVKDPATGKRRKGSKKQRGPAALLETAANAMPGLPGMGERSGIPFSAIAVAAFIGWRVFQLVRRRLRKNQPLPQQPQQPAAPHAPIIPAMLRHALPKLGGTSRVKRLAQQHRAKPRRAPTARQKMAPGASVRQRRQGMLEKLDGAVKQQALAVAAQQARSAGQQPGGKEALPLPSVQPMMMLAEGLPSAPAVPVEQVLEQPVQQPLQKHQRVERQD